MASDSDLLGASGRPDAPPRHPEKAHRPDQPAPHKPAWIRVKAPGSAAMGRDAQGIVKDHGLVTVCEEAGCPNIGECWEKKHATFMIMGDTCTRACAFCNVKTGLPRRARRRASRRESPMPRPKLGLAHVVITSVDRDDLADGGAGHFAQVNRARSAPQAAHDDRGPDPGFPAQAGRARRSSSPPSRTYSTTISKPSRRNISKSVPAPAISIRSGCCSGSRSLIRRCSRNPGSWSALARRATRSCSSWTICARPTWIS